MNEPQTQPQTKPLTIGVFDSGFGGLTVLRALLPLLPHANYIYLGDTARLPYGSKSRETIARYAVSSAKFLHDQGADLLVIACNTATALALEDIQQALPIPVIGVVEPGAHAVHASFSSFSTAPHAPNSPHLKNPNSPDSQEPNSLHLRNPSHRTLQEPSHLKFQEPSFRPKRSEAEKPASLPQPIEPSRPTPGTTEAPSQTPQTKPPQPTTAHGNVLVLATAATVQSRAYTHALNALGLSACEKACPLLVPLVEEGWTSHPVTDEVLRIYLSEALAAAPDTTTLLLGCTHYPLLEPAIHRVLATLHHPLTIIDSAASTARATAALVAAHFPNTTPAPHPTHTFYATDSIEKFQRLGSAFLGHPVAQVNLLDLGG